MLKFLGSREGYPGPRQSFITYVLQRYTDMLRLHTWVTSEANIERFSQAKALEALQLGLMAQN